MRGTFYGIGVGPGDPELMTLKAVRLLKSCPVIAVPHADLERCTAYGIARQAVPEIEGKEALCLPMPMTMDREKLEAGWRDGVRKTAARLERGEDVAMITLGDPTVYSTCLYLKERLDKEGYRTCLVSGVPSFCAAAARLGAPLVNSGEELHVLPASHCYGGSCAERASDRSAKDALDLPGVKVFMKAGKQMGGLKALLQGSAKRVVMVENCGMEGERVYESPEDIPSDAGYYSLVIVRD